MDTKLILLTALEPELQLFFYFSDNFGSHLGSHLEYFHSKCFRHLIIINNEFHSQENLYIDTKIIFLPALEPELQLFFNFCSDFGSHLGGHLEFVNSKCFEHLIIISNEFLTHKNLCTIHRHQNHFTTCSRTSVIVIFLCWQPSWISRSRMQIEKIGNM